MLTRNPIWLALLALGSALLISGMFIALGILSSAGVGWNHTWWLFGVISSIVGTIIDLAVGGLLMLEKHG